MAKSTLCEHLDQRILSGGRESALMEALATCFAEEIRRYARSRCGERRSDVEDISQEVLLAAQTYLRTFRGDASLRTWLFRLVLSACSRRRRGRKNDPRLHRSLEEAGSLPGDADPEASLLINERLGALAEALKELKPADRTLLREVEWKGLTLAEVGRRHGLSVPAVKSRMFRIRRQLKDLVSAKFAGEVRADDV
jgi:RNA polymerase sigma-70 factor (ECF subfamily)